MKNDFKWLNLKGEYKMKLFKRRSIDYTNTNYVLGHVLYSLEENLYCFDNWYQREQVWNMNHKQEFLKSLMNDEEIGTFIYYEKATTEFCTNGYIEIIDGNNRIHCLKEFFENKLPYILDGKKYYFKDMDKNEELLLSTKLISVKIFKGTHRELSDKEKVQIYLNFNKKGVPQSPEHLEKLEKFLESEEL